ncbi:MAG TPA: hypothetical protein VGN76_01835 [Gemmatimonadales bacterium]|nr:hypothetical protein [Gemmatimonadales bacterium]
MKFVLPSVWLAGFAAVTVGLFAGDGSSNRGGPEFPAEMKWLFLGATVLGGLFLYWGCMRLKRVDLDEDALYISNYLREVRVPLRDIEEVTENRWINIRPVTVEFRRDTDFGPRITFMPKTRWWSFWRAHPVVGELEAAARRSRGLPPEQL